MRTELYQPLAESEARLLILICAFTGPSKALEGRTKLAKLDFFLRYPEFLKRALAARNAQETEWPEGTSSDRTTEGRMIRYRYGPWDPMYFTLLGRLIGRGLVATVPQKRGIGFKATAVGQDAGSALSNSPSWGPIAKLAKLERRHLDLSGTNLKNFIYENFPEVREASWGKQL